MAAVLLATATLGIAPGTLEAEAQSNDTVTYKVPGLHEKAEILVDSDGVPHLYAGEHYDAFFVQGFNAARDRLWQIDLHRKRGLGLLSKDFGPAYVEQDRANRLFNYRGNMHREWLAYGDDTKKISQSFTDGINAFVALALRNDELMPWEFEFLGYEPDYWEPEDVVRLRTHSLIGNLSSEVERAYFVRDHGIEYEDIRAPLEPDHDLTVPEGLDLDALPEDQDDLLRVYDLATSGVSFDADDLAGLSLGTATVGGEKVTPAMALQEQDPGEAGSAGEGDSVTSDTGSNNWAVSPGLTSVDGPFFASDPHRAQAVPSLRYVAHLKAPGLNVIGAGEPGLPGISLGHNRHISFGLTVFSIDQEDLYVYRTNPRNPNKYRYRGRWAPMEIDREEVEVRGGDPVSVELKFTRHGPVFYEDPQSHTAFAVRTAFTEPGTAPYFASIGYMRAANWREFLGAMNRWGLPGENLMFASRNGDIGWKPGGLTPIRNNWDGLLPVPGNGRYEWQDFRDNDELPVSFNPQRGWEATANEQRLFDAFETGPEQKYVQMNIGFEWSAPWRAQRIREVLGADDNATLDDMLALQADNLSIPARRILTALGSLETDSPELRAALDLLAEWDHHMDNDSAAAALFEQWTGLHGSGPNRFGVGLLAEAVEDHEVVEAIGEPAETAFVDFVEHPESWFEDGAATRDRVALQSLAEAVAAITEDQGGIEQWRFGPYNQQELIHPLSGLVDSGTRDAIDIGPAERRPTPNVVGNSGASWRFIAEPGNWNEARFMSNPGESGDPDNPFYENLFEPWAASETLPLRFDRTTVRADAVERIVLIPSG